MIYREFKEIVAKLNDYNDYDNIIFVTPDGTVCRDVKVSLSTEYRNDFETDIVVSLVNDELKSNTDNTRPPVEDDIKLDIFDANVAKNNVIKANIEHYTIIKNLTDIISKVSKMGRVCHNFIIPCITKTDKSGVYYEEAEICGIIRWHFANLGFTVKDKFDDKNNCTEFFISW